MLDNIALLNQLFSEGQISLKDQAFLTQTPVPLPEKWDFDRVEGMLLGLAIGDALGNTTESQLPATRRNSYGEIRDYLPNRYAGDQAVGVPSDDTQMSFWTLEQLISDHGLVPDRLARKFTEQQIFGIGSTVKDFLRAYKNQGQPWERAGQLSAGNGALMRMAPILIPHLRQPSSALWADAAIAGMITHNDPASIACCVSLIHILWECLRLKNAPEPTWWIDTFSEMASLIEGDTAYSSRNSDFAYRGPVWQFVDQEVRRAINENWSTLEACERWYSGAFLLETMPCVLYILACYGNDPETAIVRAVNDTKDNDTIAAIVGAVVGALHGRVGMPARWIQGLSGRTNINDEWHIFELIEDAKQTFWQVDPPLTKENIESVISFLPLFEQSDFKPGEWIERSGEFPYFNYSPQVTNFMETLYKNNFIQPFNWGNWEEGNQFLDKPMLLEKVGLQTLRKLLTLGVRADRFNEGYFASMIESGFVLKILKRMAEINNSTSW